MLHMCTYNTQQHIHSYITTHTLLPPTLYYSKMIIRGYITHEIIHTIHNHWVDMLSFLMYHNKWVDVYIVQMTILFSCQNTYMICVRMHI